MSTVESIGHGLAHVVVVSPKYGIVCAVTYLAAKVSLHRID